MTQIFKDYSTFLSREDKEINGVSEEFAKENPNYIQDNESNKGCWNCSDCSYCSYCSSCRSCSEKNGVGEKMEIPVLENIHSKVLDAVYKGKLDMSQWHTCDTTHCRAGWVVHLAGEAGLKLEKQTSTAFAALQIYKASSNVHVSPCKFYGTNQKAMKDIKRCAELEKAQ